MKIFFLSVAGIAILSVLVAVLNTVYHRLVIGRRTKKLDPYLEDWQRHQMQGRRMRHGRAPEIKAFDPDMGEQIANRANLPRKPYVQSERKAVFTEPWSENRPILHVAHSMWCPTCGSKQLDVKQPGEGSIPTFKCVSCGQGFCVTQTMPVTTKTNNYGIAGRESASPEIYKWAEPEDSGYSDAFRSTPPEQNGHRPEVHFGGGDFSGGGAGSSYDSDSSSQGSDSSSDSGSYDSGSDSGSGDSSSSND